MSPRAAWRLEELGFDRVYDFVGGKLEWLSRGLPTEGEGPHYAVAGEVVEPDAYTCGLDHTAGQVRAALQRGPDSICVVANAQGIVLGRVRWKDLPTEDDVRVRDFMQPGPATVRPVEQLAPLVERMHAAGVATIIVSTAKGKLLGVVNPATAEQRLRDRPNP